MYANGGKEGLIHAKIDKPESLEKSQWQKHENHR
jgi:hypothetical protein